MLHGAEGNIAKKKGAFAPWGSRRSATALFALVILLWLALDLATKRYFDSGAYAPGQVAAGPFLGLFDFLLVHNTGAAWGIFSDATLALGVFSLVVCLAVVALFAYMGKQASLVETMGMALVVSGGLGNALDRFFLGYVVDFIHVLFFDFPVFNIADIGVTCGIVLFLVGFLVREHAQGSE